MAALPEVQGRYNLVMAHYLAGAISLSRMAELLELPWLDLRARLHRLDVPLRTPPADLGEALADVETAATTTIPDRLGPRPSCSTAPPHAGSSGGAACPPERKVAKTP